MRMAAFPLLFCIGFLFANTAQADDEYAFAESGGGRACHQVTVKIVGPSIIDIAKKYIGDKAAESILSDKVVNGGVGVWGAMPMDAGNVTYEDAATLVNGYSV